MLRPSLCYPLYEKVHLTPLCYLVATINGEKWQQIARPKNEDCQVSGKNY